MKLPLTMYEDIFHAKKPPMHRYVEIYWRK